MFRKSLFLAMGLAAALTVSQARAGTVTLDLDTGVNGSGASLPAFSPDSHYTLEAVPWELSFLLPFPRLLLSRTRLSSRFPSGATHPRCRPSGSSPQGVRP